MTIERSNRAGTAPAKRPRNLVRGGLVGVALTAALVGGLAAPASAAPGDTSGDTSDANVAVTAGITMTGLTNQFTLTGAPGATITGLGAVSLSVETNNVAGYTVTVQSADATMLPPDVLTNTDSIPIAALKVRESGTTTYSPVSSTGAVTVHSQAGRSIDQGDALSNDFQIRIPTVNVDTYTATLDYVATTL